MRKFGTYNNFPVVVVAAAVAYKAAFGGCNWIQGSGEEDMEVGFLFDLELGIPLRLPGNLLPPAVDDHHLFLGGDHCWVLMVVVLVVVDYLYPRTQPRRVVLFFWIRP